MSDLAANKTPFQDIYQHILQTDGGVIQDGTGSNQLDLTLSGSLILSGSLTVSGSTQDLNAISSSFSTRVTNNEGTGSNHRTRINNIESSGSTGLGFWSGSGADITRESNVQITGTLEVSGNLIVSDRITAQEFHTEFVSSSIIFDSGSTIFGDTLDDIHLRTGSLQLTGSNHHIFGNVGIGTNNPTVLLDVNGSTLFGNTLDDVHENTGSLLITGSLNINNGGLFISGSNVGIGTVVPVAPLEIQSLAASMRQTRYSDVAAQSAGITIQRSAGTTVGTDVIVQDGWRIANFNLRGYDGSSYITAATIEASIDGAPGVGDMPGRIVFSTTADGASSATERLRIDSSGNIGIGTTSSQELLHVFGIISASNILTDNGGTLWTASAANATRESDVEITGALGVFGNVTLTGSIHIIAGNAQASSKVHIRSASLVIDGKQNAQLQLRDENGSTFSLSSGDDGNGVFSIAEDGEGTRLVIDTNGNVGIGITNPGANLHISGTSGTQFRITSDTGSFDIVQGVTSFPSHWALTCETGSIGLAPNGGSILFDVQAGTTITRQTFQLLDNILLRLGNGNDYQMKYDSGDDRFEFINAAENILQTVKTIGTKADFDFGAGDLFVSASGRVGIGTQTPRNNLDVVGNIIASANIGIGLDTPLNRLHISGALGDFMRIDLGGSSQEARISGRAGSNSITSIDFGNTSAACLALNARGCMNFAIDTDSNETAQRYRWFKDAEGSSGTEIMELNESGSLMVGLSISKHEFTGSFDVTGEISASSLDIAGTGSFGFITKQGGAFKIDHPDPSKPDKELWHSFVESPTAGDNIYRFEVEAQSDNEKVIIDLPDYFRFLNERPQIFIQAVGFFGHAYGYCDFHLKKLKIMCEKKGFYDVLLVATRKDKDAVKYWNGVER